MSAAPPEATASTENLADILPTLPEPLSSLLPHLVPALAHLSHLLQTELPTTTASSNTFGDTQLSLDLLADKLIFAALKSSHAVHFASSEETAAQVDLGGEACSVAFDPLDGSSIIPQNFAVGTIIAIFPPGPFSDRRGDDIIAAIVASYGPRTELFIAIPHGPNPRCLRFLLTANPTPPPPRTPLPSPPPPIPQAPLLATYFRNASPPTFSNLKLFAPANLRAATALPGYSRFVNHCISNRFTLRYSGGLVPDVLQLLVKGGGVYSSPATGVSGDAGGGAAPAKLRVLYELVAMACVVECAGGEASDGAGRFLARKLGDLDERSPVCYGSPEWVSMYDEMVGPMLAGEAEAGEPSSF